MKIDADSLYYKELNEQIRQTQEKEVKLKNCSGQRYIGCAEADKKIEIEGIPGNALGAYLNGADIVVYGNAQDATGDTMNEGTIVIHGSSGDATGYAMRGGKIFVKENSGYRTGIHMKAYKDKFPVILIGGKAGSFLGEYQAGGLIIVLGIGDAEKAPVGYFCGTGMHGGKIFLRCNELRPDMPKQVSAKIADEADLLEIDRYITEFCSVFSFDKDEIMRHNFFVLTPNTKNPYKQLYTYN